MLVVFLLAAWLLPTSAHICITSPKQRGPLNTSDPLDPSCARVGWPCGGQALGAPPYPLITIMPPNDWWDGLVNVKFQQNANLYAVGFPGYMQLAYTTNTAPKSDDDFTVIDLQVDSNWHQQSHQQNVEVNWRPPTGFTGCNPCTFQLRYVSHMPTKEPFYQCADVHIAVTGSIAIERSDHHHSTAKLIASAPAPVAKEPKRVVRPFNRSIHNTPNVAAVLDYRQALKKRHPGFMDDGVVLNGVLPNFADGRTSEYISIDTDVGKPQHIAALPFLVSSSAPPTASDNGGASVVRTARFNDGFDGSKKPKQNVVSFVDDGVFAKNGAHVYFIGHETGSYDDMPSTLITVSGRAVSRTPLVGLWHPISALGFTDATGLFGVQLVPDATNSSFQITLVGISVKDGTVSTMKASDAISSFVDFQWLEVVVDPQYGNATAYVLVGDVGAPETLATRLYTFTDLSSVSAPIAVANATIDVSSYTFSAVTEYKGVLYAASPGLMPQDTAENPAWHLVKVDPKTGAVAYVSVLAPEGMFRWHYSGNVFYANGRELFMRLDLHDEYGYGVILTVDLDTNSVAMSEPGVYPWLHNIAYVGTAP